MKVFRLEHKKTKWGICHSHRHDAMPITELTYTIRKRLTDLWMESENEYPNPRREFIKKINRELVEYSGKDIIDHINSDDPESKRLLIRRDHRLNDFEHFAQQTSTRYGCTTLEGIASWVGNDKKLLTDIVKDGYFLYEIKLKDNAFVYNLDRQVVFDENDIVKKSVLHAVSTLKEFVK